MELEIIPVTNVPDKYIIYRPRLGMAFVGNHAMAKLARRVNDRSDLNIPQNVRDFLQSAGFFAPDPAEPLSFSADFRPTMAVLLMTNQCQLRCTYCYAAAGNLPQQQLSVEVGRAAIDHVFQNALDLGLDSFDVSFHGGGEPTFAWKCLQGCVEHARQKALPARITLTSNGVWSPRQCEWIIQNLDGVSLSIDGTPETQDNHRPLVSGGESSPFVMRSVTELDRHHFPYGVRMTATAPWTHLVEDVQFLCENSTCHSIQIEPAFNIGRGGHGTSTQEECELFIEAFLAAAVIAKQAQRRLYYSGARPGTVTATFCRAPFGALIVGGSGDLVTCYEVTDKAHPLADISRIGYMTAAGEIFVDYTARERLHQLMAERREACRTCFCYWSCAGDCYVRTFEPNAEGHQARGHRCHMNRRITEQLLLQNIAASGGIWRR